MVAELCERCNKVLRDGFGLTVADRLNLLKGSRSASEFARLCDIRESSVRQYLSGDSAPSLENLIKISRATGVSIDWIATGSGPQTSRDHLEDFCEVPYLEDRPSAGAGGVGGSEPQPLRFPAEILRSAGLRPENTRLLEAHGDSMLPIISNGDLLAVDISQREPQDGSIYVFTLDGHLFVKRLRRSIQGWMIVSDNREMYPPEPIPPGLPFDVHGVVRWVGRRL